MLSADFTRLGEQCQAAMEAGGDAIHFDVMDGHFVPNLSMGPALCAAVRHAVPDAFIDVHLMCTDPAHWIAPFARVGANHIQFHAEATDDPRPIVRAIREAGMTAGMVVNPDTEAAVLFPWLELLDTVMLMSVHPGYSGQKFIAEVLPKAGQLRARLAPHQRILIDGGVSPETAPACRDAGCDVLLSASAIFGARDMAQAIREIRGG